jgi:hypothetical protein
VSPNAASWLFNSPKSSSPSPIVSLKRMKMRKKFKKENWRNSKNKSEKKSFSKKRRKHEREIQE